MIVYWCAVIGIIILIVGVTANCARIAYHIGYNIFHDTPYQENSTEEMMITVPEGCTMNVLAKALEQEGIIEDDLIFYIQSMLYGYELVPGEHIISPSMTSEEIMKELSAIEAEEES